MYITTNPVNQDLYKNFEAVKSWSNNNSAPIEIAPVPEKCENKKEKLNLPVLGTTILGTVGSLLLIRKMHGLSIKNDLLQVSKSNDFKTNFKNIINFFDLKKVELKEMLILGGGSILGGLLGGKIADKTENFKNKLKEGVYQISNIAITSSSVFALLKLVDKLKIPHNSAFTAATIAATAIGIIGGLKLSTLVANKINNSVVDKECQSKRAMKLKDSLIHVDDITKAFIFASPGLAKKFGLNKFLLLLTLLSGYEAGKQK